LAKAGYKFVYVLDNIDWDEKAHDMRREVQNRSVHDVATSIVFDHRSNHVPDLILGLLCNNIIINYITEPTMGANHYK
jgi:hypothetical protein